MALLSGSFLAVPFDPVGCVLCGTPGAAPPFLDSGVLRDRCFRPYALKDLLGDPVLHLASEYCQMVVDPASPREVSAAVRQDAQEATDTLVVYYAGHVDGHEVTSGHEKARPPGRAAGAVEGLFSRSRRP